jgi:hypothetical protein
MEPEGSLSCSQEPVAAPYAEPDESTLQLPIIRRTWIVLPTCRQLKKQVPTRVYPKFRDWVDNEINNNRHSLRSNTKGYGGKIHLTDSQNSDTTAPSGRELYNLQFLLQAASPETFGYTLVSLKTCSALFRRQ